MGYVFTRTEVLAFEPCLVPEVCQEGPWLAALTESPRFRYEETFSLHLANDSARLVSATIWITSVEAHEVM